MIDYKNIKDTIVSGLETYLKCPVIRSNQNKKPPPYPYTTFTITTLMSENKGTWQEHTDGVDRKAITQTWSLSFLSDDNFESVSLANKAREWLDHVGTKILNENGVIIQSVGPVTNRDNILSVEYEYKNGFDVVIWLYDEIGSPVVETVDYIKFNNQEYKKKPTVDELNAKLENRLDGEE